MKDLSLLSLSETRTVIGMRDITSDPDYYPSRVKDKQKIEEKEMFDPDFEAILSHLDRTLDQIPEKEYDLKRYVIEATLLDPDDPEAIEIINQGMINYGPVSRILVQNV